MLGSSKKFWSFKDTQSSFDFLKEKFRNQGQTKWGGSRTEKGKKAGGIWPNCQLALHP